MKKLILVLALLWACTCSLEAQQLRKGIIVDFGQLSVAFNGDPKQSDSHLLTLIDARLTSGGKERFGLTFGSATEKTFEILDKDGAVLKSLSSGELFGGKGGSTLSADRGKATSRRVEWVSSIDLPNGNVRIFVRALATGEAMPGSSDRYLVVTLALQASRPMTLALRTSLPVLGNVEGGHHGFVLTPKSESAAVSASLYPAAAGIAAGKGKIVLKSAPVVLDGASESPAFWLVLEGNSASGTAGAKEAALMALKEKRLNDSDPHILVVSATDRQTSQPGDTVTYVVVCANIGSSGASKVSLSNPIPEGTRYLDGTATSGGSVVTFERSTTGVRNIAWTFSNPVEAGGERLVSFKVLIR